MKKQAIKKILASKFWFLIASLIFTLGGIRFLLREDKTGAIIYFIGALLFLIGFIAQAKFNKK
jgi:hypothetical protein